MPTCSTILEKLRYKQIGRKQKHI